MQHEHSIMNVLSLGEVKIMKEQPWWTACQMTPFLVKGAIVGDSYIIIITNLRQTWVRKADRQQIIHEKQAFNSTIESNTFAGICELLELIITKQNKKESYDFQIDQRQKLLIMNFHSVVKIYPLKWQFTLNQIKEQEHFDLLFEDLINPLISTVRSLEQRCNYFREELHQTERELQKRMNEREKQSFRSKVIDGELEWRQSIVEEGNIGTNCKMASLEFGPQANFFIKYYSLQTLLIYTNYDILKKVKERLFKQQNNIPTPILKTQHDKVVEQKKISILDAYEQSLGELFGQQTAIEEEAESIQPPKAQKKKDKKKDFF